MKPTIEAGNIFAGTPCYHVGQVREDCVKYPNHFAVNTPLGMVATGDSPKTTERISILVDDYECGFIDGSVFFVKGRIIDRGIVTKQRGALSQGYVPGKPRTLGFTLMPADGVSDWTSLSDFLMGISAGESKSVFTGLFSAASFSTVASATGRATGRKYDLKADGDNWTISCRDRSDADLPGRPNSADGSTSEIRSLDVGEKMAVTCDPKRVTSIRATAARVAKHDGATYTVSATPTGCTVTRTS